MPDMKANQLYEMIVFGENDGQAMNNVLHYVTTEDIELPPGTFPLMQDALQEFQEQWREGMLQVMAASTNVLAYELREIVGIDPNNAQRPQPIYGLQDVREGTAEDVGVKIGNPMATFNAVNYRKVGALRKKWFRGSLRVGPPTETDTDADDGNTFDQQAQVIHDAAGDVIGQHLSPGAFLGPNMFFSIYSRTQHLIDGGDDPTQYTTTVVNMVASPFVSSQVSRKRRFRLQ